MTCGLQVWNLTNCKLKANLQGHQGYINTVTVSPDGSLCASGGKVGITASASHFVLLIMPQNYGPWHVPASVDEMAFRCAAWRGALCVEASIKTRAVAGGSSA